MPVARIDQSHQIRKIRNSSELVRHHAAKVVVAATHRDLAEMIQEKQFRSDLYYRINVFPISIPPLRDRPEDIAPLVHYFAQEFGRQMNKTIEAISTDTMDALTWYPWPGNIRELQNVIERSVVVHQKGKLSVKKSCLAGQPSHPSPARQSLRRSASEDRKMIDSALAEAGGRVSGPLGAAARLGIPPSTLESKIRAMNIDKCSFKTSARTSSRTSRIGEPIGLS